MGEESGYFTWAFAVRERAIETTLWIAWRGGDGMTPTAVTSLLLLAESEMMLSSNPKYIYISLSDTEGIILALKW